MTVEQKVCGKHLKQHRDQQHAESHQPSSDLTKQGEQHVEDTYDK